MSPSIELPLSRVVSSTDAVIISISIAALYITVSFITAAYDAFFGPLSKFPGPKLRAFSRIPRIITLAKGNDPDVYPALHRKYGPIVRIAPGQLSFNGGAQVWKDLHGFKKQGAPRLQKHPFFYDTPFNGVPNLIQANDVDHSRQRKLLSNGFADKTLKELEPMLKEWATLMCKKLTERSAAGEPIDMLKHYNCTTFDIMGDLCFNEGLNMLEDGEYSPWVNNIFGSIKEAILLRAVRMTSSFGDQFIRKYVMRNKAIRVKQAQHWGYTAERVDRRLSRTPERVDLWSKILEKSPLGGEGSLTVGEHQSIASLFMIAGTETTATALSGTTYHLLRNPKCFDKLKAELRSSHGSLEDVTLESIAHLKYLQAVLQEGLRMYPPVPAHLARKIPQGGAVVGGEFIPEGTFVAAHHLSTYTSEDHFKNAAEFHPERWLGDPEYKDDHLDALEPFSVGPRNCLGKNLAWHEMRLLLAVVALYFDAELCAESADWTNQRVYTLWEKKPLMCKLTAVNG